jgi:hypothetical protein
MKTEYELIVSAIKWGKNRPGISQTAIAEEEKKLAVCNRCPEREQCWSCGVREWWMDGGINRYVEQKSREFSESGRTVEPTGYGRQKIGTTCIGGHIKYSTDAVDEFAAKREIPG